MALPIAVNKTYGVSPGENRFGGVMVLQGAPANLAITGGAGVLQRGRVMQGAAANLAMTGYAGVLDLDQPAWYESQSVSTWKALGSNTVFDVQPAYSLTPGRYQAIIGAWNSGALIYKNGDPHLAVFGGGHADYWGNEIPGFNLMNDAPAWALLAQPSSEANCAYNDPDGVYPDGRPSSTHTYDGLEYASGNFWLFGSGACWSNPAIGSYKVFSCAMSTGAWTQHGVLPWTFAQGQFPGSICARHSSSGTGGVEEIWCHGIAQGGIYAFRPDNDTWRGPYGDWYGQYQMTSAIDPARNKLLALGSEGLLQWNLSGTPSGPTTPSTTGTGLTTPNAPGFQYIPPPFDRFLAWNNSGQGIKVLNHTVTPYVWSDLTIASGGATPPVPSDYNGTFKRFRYVPGLHGLVVVNDYQASVYFFKLPATP